MTLPIDYLPGLQSGWWFTAVFGLVNLFFLFHYPKRFARRLFKLPPFASVFERVISMISMIVFMRGMMVVTVFLPFEIRSFWFTLGTILYLTGLLFYMNAMLHFANTPDAVPVVTGAYRFSRHPLQVFSLIMWVGVGIATTNGLILMICLLQPILATPFMKCQERFCLKRYGQSYQDYLLRTPRYLITI